MSPTTDSHQRRSRCRSSRKSTAALDQRIQNHGSFGFSRRGKSQLVETGSSSCSRLALVTWISAIIVVCLLVFGEVIQPVDCFAVMQDGLVELANSEAIQSVERYQSSEHDGGKLRVRRKATSGGKPATCTCTCETALVSAASQSTAAGKPTEDKSNKDTVQQQQQQQQHRGTADEKHSLPSNPTRYVYRQQQQPHPLQQQVASSSVVHNEDIVSADEPTKSVATVSGGSAAASSSSFDTDYDESFGIPYGRHSQQNHNRDEQTADQMINDIDSIDSRHPWLLLPDRMCYREPCSADRDCCRGYNICDRSANVCTDCWYGNPCMSTRDCCQKYPHCQIPSVAPLSAGSGVSDVNVGKCVDI